MIIVFAWTTPALLAGAKTVTRRAWSPEHAARFTAGMLVDAWDRSPRTGRGKKVATIRITRDSYRQRLCDQPDSAYVDEGFAWIDEHGFPRALVDARHRAPTGLTSARQFFEEYQRKSVDEVWVIEFELVEVLAKMKEATWQAKSP